MEFAPLDIFFPAADGVSGDAVGTRLAVLATLDASGVIARLILHGAVLRFPGASRSPYDALSVGARFQAAL
jgi:hypothetical protein